VAQKVEVRLTCDLDEAAIEATEVVFGYDGRSYTFELCEDHLTEFNELLGAWAGAARRVGGMNVAGHPIPRPRRAPERAELTAIREWANQNGYELSERGRLPAGIRKEYEEAMAGQQLIREIEVDIAKEEQRSRPSDQAPKPTRRARR
jgi:hypothetical protein